MALSNKQRAFVAHYVTHWNASAAARAAGYSAKTAGAIGHENLKKPEIAAAIQQRLDELTMRADEVLVRLTAHARASLADVLRLPDVETADADARAAWAIDLVKAQQTGAIHAIKTIKHGQYGDTIELHDPLRPLELLGKYHKLFGDDSGILKYLDLSKLSRDQLQRIAAGENPIAVLIDQSAASGTGGA